MAHLTSRAPPFRRPIALDPRLPNLPSPPETDSDFAFQSVAVPSVVAAPPELEPLHTTMQARRTSTLSYHNTPVRETRERASTRISKWLVVVLPSDALTSHLGSSGLRASQGTLMPLLPTLYAQLTAIAREFGFPSVVGLCVFLHLTEQGVTTTPRVSEDTWQILWGHLFDARSPTVSFSQPPVCGRIELDVDVNKARWYDSWVTQRRRAADPSLYAPPSATHWRGESRTTFLEDHTGDEHSEYLPPPRPRHVPRQLSLLDRFETGSVISSLNNHPGVRAAQEAQEVELDVPPAATAVAGTDGADMDVLTAVPERDEKLASRVKSWRASSSVAPSPMAATGQVSLDPVHMPNGIALPSPPAPVEGEEPELRLEDFQWSVSSEGPGDYHSAGTPTEWERAPSVHLAGRLEGSVLLSPSSIATSWGPMYDSDDYLGSPVSWSRVSSVDLARRLEGSVLLSPSVATSWGPDDHDYNYDHLSLAMPSSRALASPHLADRCLSDSPNTPTTATSWGPGSYPASEAAISRPSTPHLAHRCCDNDDDALDAEKRPSVWPYVDANQDPSGVASRAFPYMDGPRDATGVASNVFPYMNVPPDDVASRVFPYMNDPRGATGVASHIFPYITTSQDATGAAAHVFPYTNIAGDATGVAAQVFPYMSAFGDATGVAANVFPYMNVSGHATGVASRVFPYMNASSIAAGVAAQVFPYMNVSGDATGVASRVFPYVDVPQDATGVASHVFPYMDAPQAAAGVASHVFPYMGVPQNALGVASQVFPYTGVSQHSTGVVSHVFPYSTTQDASSHTVWPYHARVELPEPVAITLGKEYPAIGLYDTVYPHFEIYPGHVEVFQDSVEPSTRLNTGYPHLVIYESVYPNFEIYPGHKHNFEPEVVPLSTRLIAQYPTFDIYPSVYPVFDIYPVAHVRPAPEPVVTTKAAVSPSPIGAPSAESPSTLIKSMEAPVEPSSSPTELSIAAIELSLIDISLSIRESVYPQSVYEIYPQVTSFDEIDELSVALPALYPTFNIYPATYPSLEVYPGAPIHLADLGLNDESLIDSEPAVTKDEHSLTTLDVRLPGSDRASYPSFDIYPALRESLEATGSMNLNLGLPTRYPVISLYPARYPYFEIYPGVICNGEIGEQPSMQLSALHFVQSLYYGDYPHLEIYPARVHNDELTVQTSTALYAHYPIISLYPALYPFFEIYPGVVSNGEVRHQLPPSPAPVHLAPASSPVVKSLPSSDQPSSGRFIEHPSIDLKALYPVISLYPARYPFFEIYPGVVSDGEVDEWQLTQPLAVHLQHQLSPACYPSFEIYPGHISDGELDGAVHPVDIRLESSYPQLTLYPARYPTFEIYPGHLSNGELDTVVHPVDVSSEVHHPRAAQRIAHVSVSAVGLDREHSGGLGERLAAVDVTLDSGYPHFNLYPARYPDLEIYPAIFQLATLPVQQLVSRPRVHKSHATLHAEVFGAATRRARRTHAQLHEEVKSAVKPASPALSDCFSLHDAEGASSPGTERSFSLEVRPRSSSSSGLAGIRSPGFSSYRRSAGDSSVINSPTTRPSGHRRTGSSESTGSLRGPRPITPGHRRTDSSESSENAGSARGPRPLHRRTESTESTESIDSQTGLPRRRDPPPVAMRAPVAARRRSGIVGLAAPPPPLDEASLFSPEDVPEELLPPAPRRLPDGVTKNGLPTHPAFNRPPQPQPQPAQYPHNLSPVAERPPTALQRATSLQSRSTVSRQPPVDSAAHAPRRRARDSLVLEKARMFDGGMTGEPTWAGMRQTLNEFPEPPPPPVPALPSSAAGRPVSRLDRTKYPFM